MEKRAKGYRTNKRENRGAVSLSVNQVKRHNDRNMQKRREMKEGRRGMNVIKVAH